MNILTHIEKIYENWDGIEQEASICLRQINLALHNSEIKEDGVIWYLYDEDTNTWDKLLYLPEKSSLNDIFEYVDGNKERGIQKGGLLDMYYGSMEKLIKKGYLKKMKQTFEEYIDNLKKTVTDRPPKSDNESGFKAAVMIIHTMYKHKK